MLLAFEDLSNEETRENLKRLVANAADFSEEGVLALRDLRALRGRVTQSLDGIDALVAEASMGQAALLADVRASLEQANPV